MSALQLFHLAFPVDSLEQLPKRRQRELLA